MNFHDLSSSMVNLHVWTLWSNIPLLSLWNTTHSEGALFDHVWGNELITEVNLTPSSNHVQVFFDFVIPNFFMCKCTFFIFHFIIQMLLQKFCLFFYSFRELSLPSPFYTQTKHSLNSTCTQIFLLKINSLQQLASSYSFLKAGPFEIDIISMISSLHMTCNGRDQHPMVPLCAWQYAVSTINMCEWSTL